MMLVKRFAIIVMLWQKFTMYEIAKKLCVSTSTVSRIEHAYQIDQYIEIIKILENKGVSILAILEGIDSALHLGGFLPHYGMTHKMEDYKKFQEEKRKKVRRK
jgi:transcriptional regulator with XRE-family HTH domain